MSQNYLLPKKYTLDSLLETGKPSIVINLLNQVDELPRELQEYARENCLTCLKTWGLHMCHNKQFNIYYV